MSLISLGNSDASTATKLISPLYRHSSTALRFDLLTSFQTAAYTPIASLHSWLESETTTQIHLQLGFSASVCPPLLLPPSSTCPVTQSCQFLPRCYTLPYPFYPCPCTPRDLTLGLFPTSWVTWVCAIRRRACLVGKGLDRRIEADPVDAFTLRRHAPPPL